MAVLKDPKDPQGSKIRTRRILALWFPFLTTDRIMRQEKGPDWKKSGRQDRTPLIITDDIKNANRIVATDEAAARLNLKIGTTLADARASYPHIRVEEANPRADFTLLEMIADWADRYTPLVAIDLCSRQPEKKVPINRLFQHGLFLDITGCSHLFEGQAKPGESAEEALIRDIKTRLFRYGLTVQTGLADNPGAAWAMSRFNSETVLFSENLKDKIALLPLAALRLEPETANAMERVGLKVIGQLFKMPRAPLASRFGLPLINRLDQILGDQEESIDPRLPVSNFIAERRFHEPVLQIEAIETVMASLIGTLSINLETLGEGARLLETSLFHSDGSVIRATISTAAPLRDPAQIMRLFKERLKETFERFENRLDYEATGFDIIRVSVLEKESHSTIQTSLNADDKTAFNIDLIHLIDKLCVRFGHENVYRLKAVDTHFPEEAQSRIAPLSTTDKSEDWPTPPPNMPPTRPIRFFENPEPVEAIASIPEGPPLKFRWRRVLHKVEKAEGPERISTCWWQETNSPFQTRDYYRVEDDEGRRFWLFRNGLYGNEAEEPTWYMHGLFA